MHTNDSKTYLQEPQSGSISTVKIAVSLMSIFQFCCATSSKSHLVLDKQHEVIYQIISNTFAIIHTY